MDLLKSILVVDDEEDLTWSIAKSLERNAKICKIICTNNGDSALAFLKTQRVDLVITDLRMPGRDGLALLQDIQQDYPQTRVIMMTAHGSEEVRQQIARLGASHFIEKPFDLRSLRQLIYAALDMPEVGMENFVLPARIHEPGSFLITAPEISSQTAIPAGW